MINHRRSSTEKLLVEVEAEELDKDAAAAIFQSKNRET
jgi:hypothetical protein